MTASFVKTFPLDNTVVISNSNWLTGLRERDLSVTQIYPSRVKSFVLSHLEAITSLVTKLSTKLQNKAVTRNA